MSGSTSKPAAQTGRPDKVTPDQSPTSGPALDRGIQALIGDRLRSLYGELSEQPVPDRLIAILDQMSKR